MIIMEAPQLTATFKVIHDPLSKLDSISDGPSWHHLLPVSALRENCLPSLGYLLPEVSPCSVIVPMMFIRIRHFALLFCFIRFSSSASAKSGGRSDVHREPNPWYGCPEISFASDLVGKFDVARYDGLRRPFCSTCVYWTQNQE